MRTVNYTYLHFKTPDSPRSLGSRLIYRFLNSELPLDLFTSAIYTSRREFQKRHLFVVVETSPKFRR